MKTPRSRPPWTTTVALASFIVLGCGAKPPSGAAPADADRARLHDSRSQQGKLATVPGANENVSTPVIPATAARASAPGTAESEGELHAEEREQNPRSEKVKIKLTVAPATAGVVLWGRKRLAELRPGDMSVDILRPRDSGPLDLVVRAEGYLPHHMRVFTDRDDKLSVRLFHPDEAQQLLGYRRADPTVTTPP